MRGASGRVSRIRGNQFDDGLLRRIAQLGEKDAGVLGAAKPSKEGNRSSAKLPTHSGRTAAALMVSIIRPDLMKHLSPEAQIRAGLTHTLVRVWSRGVVRIFVVLSCERGNGGQLVSEMWRSKTQSWGHRIALVFKFESLDDQI